MEVGRRVRGLFPADHPDRVNNMVTDQLIQAFAEKVAGKLGGQVGIAPRIFLKKLVNLMDTVDLHEDFDPVRDYELTLGEGDGLTAEEANAAGVVKRASDIALELDD